MIRWLYRYVFRGLGIMLLVGMMTILYLAVRSQSRASEARPVTPVTGARP